MHKTYHGLPPILPQQIRAVFLFVSNTTYQGLVVEPSVEHRDKILGKEHCNEGEISEIKDTVAFESSNNGPFGSLRRDTRSLDLVPATPILCLAANGDGRPSHWAPGAVALYVPGHTKCIRSIEMAQVSFSLS